MNIQVHSERHDADLVSVVIDCLEELGGVGPHLWDSLSPEMKSLFKAKTYEGRPDACSFVAIEPTVSVVPGHQDANRWTVVAHAYVFPAEELNGDMALGIHVMRPWQRMKIGHTLVRRVKEWVVEKKHAFIRMTTLKTNLRSQAFFKSMGFEVENHYNWKNGKMTTVDTGPHVYMRWTAPVTGADIKPAEGLSPTTQSPPTTSK